MSDQLYSSLFSLLPRNYFEGNSSTVSDNVEVATNYIKDLEKKVKHLQDKREKLMISLSDNQILNVGPSNVISNTNDDYPSNNEDYVKVKCYSETLEIEINAKVQEGAFPLSKVLKILQLEEGINVVDCTYTKVNKRLVYAIHCKVDDGKLVDSSRLKCRLTNEILLSRVS